MLTYRLIILPEQSNLCQHAHLNKQESTQMHLLMRRIKRIKIMYGIQEGKM